ncbi:hypothetical protein BGZ88_004176 [Linnemannia elongata]|nr:hypothetical protein BGZ88_004176 [Linnemannia elongata]
MKLATTLILALTLATLTIHAAPVDTAAETVEKRDSNWTGTPSKPESEDSHWKKRDTAWTETPSKPESEDSHWKKRDTAWTGTPSEPEPKDSHWKKRAEAQEAEPNGWGQDFPDSSSTAKPDDGVWL